MEVKKEMRIVFMGNPEFAVPSLEALSDNFNVVGVVTGPDRKGGRGRKELIESAVKKTAIQRGLPVLQPEKLRAQDFLEQLSSWKADLQIVVAFRMLPEVVWDRPPLGTINLHSSLLPAYRGAAPINWAIIRGETRTGLTTFKLAHAIDTGDILMSEELMIGPDETAGELHDRMMVIGADLLVKTINGIKHGSIQPQRQDESRVSSAPKIYYEDARINENATVQATHNFVRGMSPYPGAWYPFINNKTIKILRGQPLEFNSSLRPGQWISDGKIFLGLTVKNGVYKCKQVQMEGKRSMSARELLNGLDIEGSEIKRDDIFSETDK